MSAGTVPSHDSPGERGRWPVSAAALATNKGTKTRKPAAAASPRPIAMLRPVLNAFSIVASGSLGAAES
jgi:hypothetical protein